MKSKNEAFHDQIGDNHIGTSAQTPLRADAFDLSDEQKIESIKKDVANISLAICNFSVVPIFIK